MPDISCTNNMVQRRFFSIIIRAVLVGLGVFLIWRMVVMFTAIPSFDDGESIEKRSQNLDVSKIIKADIAANHSGLLDPHVPAPIMIKVYYESMCPDSKYFVVHQLLPTIKQLPDIADFKLVPYGKANTLENATGIYFVCQHLRLECEGNKFHACGVKHIENQQQLLKFVSCLFKNMRNPPRVAQSCASEVGADWNTIQQCATSMEGSQLLKMHGEDTHDLSPSVSFIPTIVLNDSQGIQKNILKDLKKEVCNVYFEKTGIKPESCH